MVPLFGTILVRQFGYPQEVHFKEWITTATAVLAALAAKGTIVFAHHLQRCIPPLP